MTHVERNQRLDSCIADVLELFVVRSVEVGLPGAEPRAAPVDLPHVRQPGKVAGEAGGELERIGDENAMQIVDVKRCFARRDLELHVPVGPEPESLEKTTIPTVGPELVTDSG